MSGGARLAVCATTATFLAACALLPLVDLATWIFQAAFLLVVQAGVGALARRVPLARPLTVAVQAVVTMVLLTLLFANQQAIGGMLPGPDAIRHLGDLLRAGADDVSRFAIPAPLTDGIRLMLVGGVVVIGLAVDALAVTFRSAAPAGLPLLALYSVAAGLSQGATDWLWFLLAAGGYLLLLLAEGRDRLSQWGRVFGGTARSPGGAPGATQSTAGAVAPVRTGRRIGALSLGIALFVPLALPTLDGGLLGPTGVGAGVGSGGGGTISAVNPLVSLQNSLNQPEDREVMSYRTNSKDTQDLYLRIVSLDEFDGTTWRPAKRRIIDVPSPFPNPRGLGADVRRTEIRTNIAAAGWYAQDWLPLPYPATKVDISGRWRYEPVGRTLVGDHNQNTSGKKYGVESLIVQPTAEQLANAPAAPSDLRQEFTRVPPSLPAVVRKTALKVTEGATNDYQRAVKLQDYFAVSGGFTYNTEVRAGSGSAAIARFLKDKEGFCVHFSFSMAAMARTLGIPARVAVGFTPGSPQSDGRMSVGLRDAHAWPELYFEGVGWTRFEPTPNRGTAPDYTRDSTPAGNPTNPAAPSEDASSQPSAGQPSASDNCPAAERKLGGCANTAPAVIGASGDGGPPFGAIALVVLGAALVVLVPLLPMLWRRRVRALRLGSAGRTGEDAAARTLAAWLEVTDTAWDHGIAPDESLTPRKAAARIVRAGQLEQPAADSVHRVAAAVEQVLYAPRPQPKAGLGDDVRRLRQGLRAGASRSARLRAEFAPRSTVRVAWSLSQWWATLGSRWTARKSALLRRASGQQS
ncbi:transglutaminaseTgpA domain-containing protein [Streptomyces sp. NPDC058067]|uniref:transglutaminaseTgpA domain-containing protein n=1 Tax=Streptomyces sp. NPDC058067 TaxID=3346324 RepID=UPI0036E9F594